MTKVYLFIVLLFSVQSCMLEKKSSDKKQISLPLKKQIVLNDSSIIKKIIIPKALKLKVLNTDFLIFVSFDGNCSSCIMDFLELAKKITKHKSKNKISWMFISYSEDLFAIENYMKKLQVKLDSNDTFIADTNRFFYKKNPFADGNPINMILTKKNGEILSTHSPFENFATMRDYIRFGIFKGNN